MQKEIDNAIREKRLYFVGDKLPPDWYAAFLTWKPLAEAGDAKAQYNIGRCYDRGDGIDKDQNLAEEWYLRAAAQDDPRANYNLHIMYSEQKSQKYDAVKAAKYFDIALQLNESRAVAAKNSELKKLEDQRVADVLETELIRILKLEFEYRKQIQSCLDTRDRVNLKEYLNSISDVRFNYLCDIDDYFDLEIVGWTKENFKDVSYVNSGIISNGNTLITKNVKRWSVYTIELRNNSEKRLCIDEVKKGIEAGATAYIKVSDSPKIKNFSFTLGGQIKIEGITVDAFEIFRGKSNSLPFDSIQRTCLRSCRFDAAKNTVYYIPNDKWEIFANGEKLVPRHPNNKNDVSAADTVTYVIWAVALVFFAGVFLNR